MPLSLSIVIPSHNRPDLLRVCLASILRHATDGAEIVVVDDASEASRVSRAAAEFPRVRSLRLPRRRGFCAAANAGIRAARHPVVELLNDDAEVTAGWATRALQHFEDNKVAAVAPLVLCWPGNEATPRIDSAGDRYYLGGVAGKRGHGEKLTSEYLQSRHVFGASASSAFSRRDVILQAGAFPETFGAYFEDVDLSFRLHWAGYEVIYEPAARVLHRVSSSYGRPSRRLLEQQSCNEERVFWRNLPTSDLWKALPKHIGVLAAKAWRRWQEGALVPFVCGRMRVIGEVWTLVKHRRSLCARSGVRVPRDWHVESRFWGAPL